MATVYSLICWGGKDGKAVTVSSSTDWVTLTRHGLKNGKGVQFASGTLPTVAGTALALNTTYYAKRISTSTCELYYDAALTNKINFTSTGSSLVLKGSYYQGLSDKSRWTYSGNEYIFDGINSWNTARAGADQWDTEVAEIGEFFEEDTADATISITVPALFVLVTTLVNGVRSSAWHKDVSGGYVLSRTTIYAGYIVSLKNYRCEVDGFTLKANGTGGVSAIACKANSGCRNMRLLGYNKTGTGVTLQATGAYAFYNHIEGFQYGCQANYALAATVFANNTVVKNATGVYAGSTVNGFWYNNICAGNTTANWGANSSGIEGASSNSGETGDANLPWMTSGGTRLVVDQSNFVNFAGSDYRPALATSPQVDVGVRYYGIQVTDLFDAEVPNYNNGGAEGIDIGCFEFNNGYGPHPVAYDFTLVGLPTGFEIHAYLGTNPDTAVEIAGTESSSTSFSFTNENPGEDGFITFIKRGFKPFKMPITYPSSDQITPVFLVTDLAYNNPA